MMMAYGSQVDGHIGDGKKWAEAGDVFGRATPGKAEDRFGSPDWWGTMNGIDANGPC